MNKIIEFFKRIFGKKQELIEAPKEEIKVNELRKRTNETKTEINLIILS